MGVHKLSNGVNCQAALKQEGIQQMQVQQGLCVHSFLQTEC